MGTTPTSFRLRRETLEQLDRLADLLTEKFHRQHEVDADGSGLTYLVGRDVSRSDALAVAVSDAVGRLERELGSSGPQPSRPYGLVADAGRGLLAELAETSMAGELSAERRLEAAADDRRAAEAATWQ
jgi:hypothetical protein